jgi:hypothetical protein
MSSPFDDQFSIDKKDRKPGRDPEPEIIVLTHRKGFVKEAHFRKKCLPHHHGGRADDAEREAFFKNPTGIFRMLEPGVNPLPFTNPDLVGITKRVVWVVV